MGIPSIAAFKAEAVQPNSEYEKRHAMMRLENFR